MSNWNKWYRNKGFKVEPEIPSINKMLKARSRVLDVGCGHGRHVMYFAGKGHEVYGLDNYKPILRQLKKDLLKADLNATLKLYDINKGLPYPNKYFDLVLATRAIHHTTGKDLREIFKEINRVTKSKGLLFLQIPSYEDSQKFEKTWAEYGKPVTHEWIEPHTYVPLSGHEKGIPHVSLDKKELVGFLKNYRLVKMHVGKRHYHGYCVIAKKI